MRKTSLILLLALLLLLVPRSFKASTLKQEPDGAFLQESPAAPTADSYAEGDDDIFSSSYEREMLSRRFFQKTLPPLSRREKIVWSFKTARANILL